MEYLFHPPAVPLILFVVMIIKLPKPYSYVLAPKIPHKKPLYIYRVAAGVVLASFWHVNQVET